MCGDGAGVDGVARKTGPAVGTMTPRDDPPLVAAYDVQSVPKLLPFEHGALVATRADGSLGVDEVLAFAESATAEPLS